MRSLSILACGIPLVLGSSCARRLSSNELERVKRPAFVSRLEDGAGPKATGFPAEEDKKLKQALARGISRYEVSERLRGITFSLLPRTPPWTHAVDPAQAASAMETLLVREVPAPPPNYEPLRQVGADSVVEFVVSSYGLRASQGGASGFVEGYARMFFLGGSEIWRESFSRDSGEMGRPLLDPRSVVDNPELSRKELEALIDDAAAELAKGLAPSASES